MTLRTLARNLGQIAKYRIKYGASAPAPYKLVHINPENVAHLLAPRFERKYPKSRTHVVGGAWDTSVSNEKLVYANNYEKKFTKPTLVKFENYIFYQSLKRHFEGGAPWEKTEFYAWLLANTEKSIIRYSTRNEIDATLHFLDTLYYDIKSNGYKSQRGLRVKRKGLKNMWRPPEYYEVCVDIGRTGEIIFDDGRHRFAIAKILGISSIPVRVLVRHEAWQNKRHEISKLSPSNLKNVPQNILSHPDILDVLPQ